MSGLRAISNSAPIRLKSRNSSAFLNHRPLYSSGVGVRSGTRTARTSSNVWRLQHLNVLLLRAHLHRHLQFLDPAQRVVIVAIQIDEDVKLALRSHHAEQLRQRAVLVRVIVEGLDRQHFVEDSSLPTESVVPIRPRTSRCPARQNPRARDESSRPQHRARSTCPGLSPFATAFAINRLAQPAPQPRSSTRVARLQVHHAPASAR